MSPDTRRRRLRPATAALVAAGVVAALGILVAATVARALGTSARDALVMIGLAAVGSVGSAVVGAVVLHRFRRRSVRLQALVVALVPLSATVAGVALASAAMFLSTHDLGALAVVLVASASISVGAAVQLGEAVGAGTRRVADLARRIGDLAPGSEDGRSLPQPGPVPEDFALLGQELAELERRLGRALQRERALEASRRELVAWVSHDLRSPIATIRAMAEALDDGVADDRATVDRYHRQIRRDAERLGTLVDDLFELSRITSGALRLERRPVPLSDVVADVVEAAAGRAATFGIELVERTDPLPRLPVDARELIRVLGNLLDNALRHTPAGGTVMLEATSDSDEVRLAVRDGCGGIPASDLARVFDVAFRGDAARGHDQRGGGLGLAIARGLVEAHEGTITVTNEAGGCRFTVHLPRAGHDGEAAAGSVGPAPSAPGRRAG